jgi:lipopolysaccharide export LptBFGC system permease protein LptF
MPDKNFTLGVNILNSENLTTQTEKILKYCVLGLLVLSALAFLFAFVINWEDRFFGIKLDGLLAGISLGATCIAAALLAAALIRFPRMSRLIGALTVICFGFLFVDSSMTIQRVSYSHQGFSPVFAVILLIAIAFLIVTVIKRRQETSKNRS